MPAKRLRVHAASLHYFDAVRRAGSIREAARRLHVASSAVNRQVLGLEAELGAALFDRLPGGLKLTPVGEVLAHHVTTVLQDAERARSELDALTGLRTGHVELVTLEGLCHRVVPDALAAFARRYQRVEVGVDILGTEAIPVAIANGDAHLGLAFEVRARAELRRLSVARFQLGAVVGPASPLAGKPWVTLSECVDGSTVFPKLNFANRGQLHAVMVQAGLADRGRYECGSIGLMKQLVLRGLGVAFMTRIGIESELRDGRLVHVPLRHNRRPIYSELGLYARAKSSLPLAAEAFAEQLTSILALCAAEDGAATP